MSEDQVAEDGFGTSDIDEDEYPGGLRLTAIVQLCIAGCFYSALYYLPIYFQAIIVGGIITVTGIHNPFLILGPAIAAVGSGLLVLLDQKSSTGQWIGFQIVLGGGVGCCLTIPLLLSQVLVKTKDVATATPFIIFAQSMGSAYLLPTAEAVFGNQLLKALRQFAPDTNPLVVLSAGANSEAISSFPRASLGGIVQSYTSALRSTFVISVPFAGVALLVGFFMPWFKYHGTSKTPTAELIPSQTT